MMTTKAIFKHGSRQYDVCPGQVIQVDQIDQEIGKIIEFDQVLLYREGDNFQIGAPTVSGCTVVAKIVRQRQGEKIRIIKMKRRKHHMKTMGHRAKHTDIEIQEIKRQ